MQRLTFATWITGRFATVLLALAFATLYFAIGPGRFFSVDEVVVEATARAVYSRHNLEIPAMNTAVPGREGGYYAGHRGPALAYAAMPLVVMGDVLDNRFGSVNGGIAAGPALGPIEHPLRWGGRLSIFVVLAANAIFAGLAVSTLYLIARSMSGDHRVALFVASAAGASTLLASEATHFFQHPLEALMLLIGFWLLVSSPQTPWRQRAWIGGLALGLALLARPSAAPAAGVIWVFGAVRVWKETNRNNPGQLVRFISRALVAPIICAALYLLHNYRQFGNVFQFGAHERAFEFSFEALKAAAAYLVSPGLSVFLFAAPLVLLPFCLKEAIGRWRLETWCILVSSLAHSLVIVFFRWWDGSVSYGPRYMLAPILLLMPLTIPGFERAVRHRFIRWRLAISMPVVLGLTVQVIGISVYVVVNEWYQDGHNIGENGAFVFIPSASPIWVQVKELLAGRNMTMWAVRAVSEGSIALTVLLIGLVSISAVSYWLAVKSQPNESSQVPAAATIAVAVLVLAGFVWTAPVAIPSEMRVMGLVNAGLEAQSAGLAVKAEELYALVLGLDPSNRHALHNLAVLYEGAGRSAEAASLHQRVLGFDSVSAPVLHSSTRDRGVRADETAGAICLSAPDCYRLGQDFLNSGDVAGALRVWETASHRFPTEVWLIRNVGWCRYQFGDYEGAIRAYSRGVDLSPDDTELRLDLAWSLLRAARFDEARRIINEALLEDAGNPAANAILGQLPRR